MDTQGLRGSTSGDPPESRRLPRWLKVVLLLGVLLIILNAGAVALARLDGKFASRQTMTIRKALGAWQAPVDYQFTGQGWIVGGTGKTWIVSGVPVRLGEQTQIIGELHANDPVILSGQILKSGVWLADRIERADIQGPIFTYNGTLDAIETGTWRAGGLDLVVTETTAITDTLAVGDQVLVTFTTRADGSKQALTIEPFDQPWIEPTALPTATPSPTSTPLPQPTFNNSPDRQSPDADPPKQKKSDNQGTVTLCHNPGKKGGHTLTVDRSAQESHLKHGDHLGPCR